MSFFGFDATLPRDRPAQGSSTLDDKLAGLGDGVQVYDFQSDAYAALEGGDELNDETFGGGSEEQARDFDFAGSTSKLDLGPPSSNKAASKPATSLLDFDDLLAPVRPAAKKPQPAARPQQPPVAAPPARPVPKTLAEIEAEMLAQRRATQPAPPQPAQPQARSLADIEAELRAQQAQHQRAVTPQRQPTPTQAPLPPRMQQPLAQPPHAQPPIAFQTHPHQPPVFPNGQPIPYLLHLDQEQQRQILFHFSPEQQNQVMAAQQYFRQRPAPPSQYAIPLIVPNVSMQQHRGPMNGSHPTMFPALPGQQMPPPPSQLDHLRSMREKTAAWGDEKAIEQLEAAIREHELAEVRRKRRLAKIEPMLADNNLMSRNDKDFVTRICVTQVLKGSTDPYEHDFYHYVYRSFEQERGGPQTQQQQPGVLASRQAMKRMANNVQRMINNQRPSNENRASLVGVLGKVPTRSRPAAPRPALALDRDSFANSKTGGLPLPESSTTSSIAPALNRGDASLAIEQAYDITLSMEQLRRTHDFNARRRGDPAPTEFAIASADPSLIVEPEQVAHFSDLRQKLFKGLHVMDPLDGRDPHPFVALLALNKGKRLVPRALRQLESQQSLTVLALVCATFGTLDVVRRAPTLDEASSKDRTEVERATNDFLSFVIPSVISLLNHLSLRIIAGMLQVLVSRNDIAAVARSRPGIAFLTILLSRGGGLKQEVTAEGASSDSQDVQQWTSSVQQLFNALLPHWLSLFPSTRAGTTIAQKRPDIDIEDQAVWQFLAAVAVCADMQQQQHLVAEVRDKVLENVVAAKRKTVAPEIGERKIRNVDLLLAALGLSSSQIQLDE